MTDVLADIVVFGDPEAGIWCDTCFLPSALRFQLVGQAGMRVIDFGKWNFCPDCDHFTCFVVRTRKAIKARFRGHADST